MPETRKPATGQTVADFGNAALACNAARPEDSPNLTDFQRQSVLACDLSHAALELAGLGFACVPLNAARIPMLKGWPDSTLDADQTRARFARPGVAGLSVMTRDFFVLDCDRNHVLGVDGVLNFADIIARHGAGEPLALGPRVRTRRGGLHAYLRAPPGVSIRSSASKLALGVDIKAGNSLATVPPTPGYSWLKHPRDAEIPLAPAWLSPLIASPAPPARPPAALRPFDGREHPYARAAFSREIGCVAGAPCGQRNAALFRAAANLGGLAAGGALDPHVVARALLDAATVCGLLGDDGLRAVESSIASGLRRGLAHPREIPKRGRAS